jgi:hypothetical protein
MRSWACLSGMWVFVAAEPWPAASYNHTFLDAVAWGVAAVCALMVIVRGFEQLSDTQPEQ